MNNKVLLAILVVLLAVFGLTRLFSGDREGTFDPEIIQVDTGRVDKIVLRTRADSLAEAILQQTENKWQLTKNGVTYDANEDAVRQLISSLSGIRSAFIAAKTKDKWGSYELGEEQATHLTVYDGTEELADFYIGKFTVDQQARQITSYFRVAGREDVYAVQGMAGMMLGQSARTYRDKQVLNLDIHAVDRLQLTGDTQYDVKREGQIWSYDDQPIDSLVVKEFLMNLKEIAGDNLSDRTAPPPGTPLKKLTISGNNMQQPVIVRVWKDSTETQPFVIQSSQFPDNYFTSDSTRLFTRLFKPVADW